MIYTCLHITQRAVNVRSSPVSSHICKPRAQPEVGVLQDGVGGGQGMGKGQEVSLLFERTGGRCSVRSYVIYPLSPRH